LLHYLANPQKAYLHFLPFACHPLLATAVLFLFFQLKETSLRQMGEKNKTTAHFSAGLRPPPDRPDKTIS